MTQMNQKLAGRLARKARISARIRGTQERPRLSVYRSNTTIYAQIIDDVAGKTLVSASNFSLGKSPKGTKSELADLVGQEIAKKAKEQQITLVSFDRNGYHFHGRVKALAEGARKGGLQF